MNLRSLIGGMTFLMLGVLIIVGSYLLEVGTLRNPEAGFIPFLSGSVIVCLSMVDIIRSLSSKNFDIHDFLSPWRNVYWGRAASLSGAILLYIWAVSVAGFLFVTPLFIGFCIKLLGIRKWVTTAVISVLSTLGFYLLMVYFQISISPFPGGLFE
jgi:putative tricarboxylic transport membrane protein